MSVRVILFGATGMVGEGVLHVCLHDPKVESVLVVSRSSVGVIHPKLTEVIRKDFLTWSDFEDRLKGYDACFFCLGVSSIGMNEEEYTRTTYDLTMAVARILARLNPAMTFCYVSGAGTDSSEHGRSMWARVKGKTENDLSKLGFKASYAFRPGFIKPIDGLKRAYRVSRALARIYPGMTLLLRKYVCTLEDLGRAMIFVATEGDPRRILECTDITELGTKEKIGGGS